jgi:HKD family nuclease
MITFHHQPDGSRLGDFLRRELESGAWEALDAAVAWVRRAGALQLEKALISFLTGGGSVRLVVGVDFEHTTKEGLELMLGLKKAGQADVYVFHNEEGPVFHPKLYLLRNQREAVLILGSNNLTESGLYANTETWLEYRAPTEDPVIADILATYDVWISGSNELARPLDAAFLQRLAEEEYVPSEDVVQERTARQRREHPQHKPQARLFGGRRIPIPPPPSGRRRLPRRRVQTRVIEETRPPSDRVLLAEIPGAGNRWSQAHFNQDIVRMFFRFEPDTNERLELRQRRFDGSTGDLEMRPIVYSKHNRNMKVELAAAKGREYPAKHRPIAIFKEIGPRTFDYVLLFPEDPEYSAVSRLLGSLPSVGKGLHRSITSLEILRRAWPSCPLN